MMNKGIIQSTDTTKHMFETILYLNDNHKEIFNLGFN